MFSEKHKEMWTMAQKYSSGHFKMTRQFTKEICYAAVDGRVAISVLNTEPPTKGYRGVAIIFGGGYGARVVERILDNVYGDDYWASINDDNGYSDKDVQGWIPLPKFDYFDD